MAVYQLAVNQACSLHWLVSAVRGESSANLPSKNLILTLDGVYFTLFMTVRSANLSLCNSSLTRAFDCAISFLDQSHQDNNSW